MRIKKKIRNDKIDGNFYTDEYVRMLNDTVTKYQKRIDKTIKVLENMSNIEGGYNQIILKAVNEVDKALAILKGESK